MLYRIETPSGEYSLSSLEAPITSSCDACTVAKELALLKRLRGGGDFCSDAHKHSYQEEYNRLALSRLLQAQKKGQQTNSPAQNTPPPTAVAVEEPVAPVREEAASETEDALVLAQSNERGRREEESRTRRRIAHPGGGSRGPRR